MRGSWAVCESDGQLRSDDGDNTEREEMWQESEEDGGITRDREWVGGLQVIQVC